MRYLVAIILLSNLWPSARATAGQLSADEINKMFVLKARPKWPYSAAGRHQYQAHGVFRLSINSGGSVTAVKILQSTGQADIDDSFREAFMRWRAKPGSPAEV